MRFFCEISILNKIVSSSEHVSTAIKREFVEEAMNSNPDGEKHIEELFKTAIPVGNY